MPRRALQRGGGLVFHVLNRAVRRAPIFLGTKDYDAFRAVLAEAHARVPTRLLAYCVMPNHWHLVLWPQYDEMPRFMHWLTMTHAKRWHQAHQSTGTGPLYQNRYNAIPVQNDRHLLAVLRYVERNALRARLVERAEDWRWCSLWERCNLCDPAVLREWPILQPEDWIDLVNRPQTASELRDIRLATKRRRPLGDPDWVQTTSTLLQMPEGRRGRPALRHRV